MNLCSCFSEMVQVLSKLTPVLVTCEHYVHPWTDSCFDAAVGLYLRAILHSMRMYGTIYVIALLMRGKFPRFQDLKKTLFGILQSTAFLSGTAFGYSMFLCLLRKALGNFNILTASFMPAFLSSVFAILIERPSRRTLLSLYVSNVATETVWNMLEARQVVTPIKYGQVAIFGISIALLLTFWRAGLYERDEHKMDPMFKIVRFVIGPHEQKDHSRSGNTNNFYRKEENKTDSSNNPRWNTNRKHKNIVFHLVNQALRAYKRIINKIKCCDRHTVCPHPFSCIYYVLQGTTKMFSIGLGLQLILKLVLNIQTLFKSPEKFGKALFRRDTLQLANFLAGSSGIFRAVSCLLRRSTGQDNPLFAFPAGLLAGIAFTQYPDTTIALYVFWKTAQIAYNLGIERRYVPDVPGFNMFLYCLSTGILFHVALLEPHNLRSSYWKFLINISGGRVACMNRKPLDVWGLGTSQGLAQTLLRTRTKEEVQFLGCKW